MQKISFQILRTLRPLFFVDSRALGIFRVLLGVLCFLDISRRWDFIDIFYTNSGIISISTSNSFYKTFTLLTTFTKSGEVHLFFLLGLIFSIFLIIGYKTKISQIICSIIIISIHNRAIMLENAGDLFFNNLLILSLFLPLGVSFSIDSLRKSLKTKENSLSDLNDYNLGKNNPSQIFSIGFFAIILQLCSIYFFTALNKTGYDWMGGTAVYKMFQLDTFLTPIGYMLRDFITAPVSKFFTYSTLTIEFTASLLLLFPFYSSILRLLFILCFFIFHLSIRIAIKVGLFSFTMISTYVLLIDKRIFEKINYFLKSKIYNGNYILFYDRDCGFCHYTVRIIKRLDIFNQIVFADSDFNGDKPSNLTELAKTTAVLYSVERKKHWIKHEAFGKILSVLPLGFLVSWIFFIPFISNLFRIIYDFIATNRTKISNFFGLPACGLKSDNINDIIVSNERISHFNKTSRLLINFLSSSVVLILIVGSLNYNLVANKSVNEYMEKYNYEKFTYNRTLRQILTYPRMIQRWNMFSPTVLGTDKTVVIEATLTNGEVIDPFSTKPPVLDNLDYPNLWHDHNQFWRKFFSRVTKKQNKKYITSFEQWLKNRKNTYFEDVLKDQKIRSVKMWSLSQRNKNINSKKENKLYKKQINNNSKKNDSKKPTKKL